MEEKKEQQQDQSQENQSNQNPPEIETVIPSTESTIPDEASQNDQSNADNNGAGSELPEEIEEADEESAP